jgi:hypothetical protein
MIRLNGMNYPQGLPFGGDRVYPKPGIGGIRINPQDGVGELIPVAEITEKPPVQRFSADGLL